MATAYNVVLGLIIGMVIMSLIYFVSKVLRRNKSDIKRQMYHLIESSKDIIYVCDVEPDLKFRYISPSIDDNLGYGVQEESYKNAYSAFERIHPEDFTTLYRKVKGQLNFKEPILQRWKNNSGEYIWFEEYAEPIYKRGKLIAIQGIIRNIDDKMKLQQDLVYQVQHDALSGIYNRVFFDQEMQRFDQTEDRPIAIILCDLDNLKQLNDQFGHKAGDKLIQSTAKLLSYFTSEYTTISRIGGDEFAFLAQGYREEEIIKLIANINTMMMNFNDRNQEHPINMSIGYAYSSHSIGQMEDLFIQADHNMYEQKFNKKSMLLKQGTLQETK